MFSILFLSTSCPLSVHAAEECQSKRSLGDKMDIEPEMSPLDDVKVVVVGDGAVGKTCLCNVFVNRQFPADYEPTVFENHTQEITVQGQTVSLQLWDTAGQEGYHRIRTLCYENTSCFVICFSVVDSISFDNVRNVWINELRSNQPSAKLLLAGTKADLRGVNKESNESNASRRKKEVSLRKIRRLVKEQHLAGYVETSALKGGDDVDRVFMEAVRLVIGREDLEKESKETFAIDDVANLCRIL